LVAMFGVTIFECDLNTLAQLNVLSDTGRHAI